MGEVPQWLTEKQVSTMTSISVQTLRNWRHRGVGPKYDKPTPRVVRYRLDQVQDFMMQGGQVPARKLEASP